MSTGLLEERDQQHATVRAVAAAIADAPRPPRRFIMPAGGQLHASQRRRRHLRAPAMPPASPRAAFPRRLVAAAVLLLQCGVLLGALLLPMFRVSTVEVSGEHVLTAQQILAAAAVPHQSIFTIDADSIRSRVLQLPWVEDATVTTQLPATVGISVVERAPSLRVRRLGVDTFIDSDGQTIPATPYLERAWQSTPSLIDERMGSTQPIDPGLVTIMQDTAERFPSLYGVDVAAYVWGEDDVVSIWTSTGWAVILGHLDTDAAIAAVPAQLAALYALTTQLNFLHPSFGYVNLENPAAPAVGGSPGSPSEVMQIDAPPVPFVPVSPTIGTEATPQPVAGSTPALQPLDGPVATPLPMASAPPTPPPRAGQTPPTQD